MSGQKEPLSTKSIWVKICFNKKKIITMYSYMHLCTMLH